MRAGFGIVLLTTLFAASNSLAFDGSWMSEDEMIAVFKGKSVAGHYENGDKFEESYGADGRVNYSDDNRVSGGKWSVKAGTFCTIYDDDPSGGCFRVRREGANCYEFHFTARDEVQAERDPRKPDWTAVAWFKGQVPTCKDGASV